MIQQRYRFTCDKSLTHPWFENFQTWVDLRSLEGAVGERYLKRLKHESYDARWQKYNEQLQASQRGQLVKHFYRQRRKTKRRLKTSTSFL